MQIPIGIILFLGMSFWIGSCSPVNEIAEQKPIIFFDQNSKEISRKEFYELRDYRYNIDRYFEYDSVYKAFLIDRFRYGKLNIKDRFAFKLWFEKILGKEFYFTKPIVITYYAKLNEDFDCFTNGYCWQYAKSEEEKHPEMEYYHVLEREYPEVADSLNVYRDNFDYFLRTVFKYRLCDLSYLVVKPDGSYMKCLCDGCYPYNSLEYDWPVED